MRAKLDENLGRRGAKFLRDCGWDMATVAEQDLCSASDELLIDHCRAENRALVSLDKDFSDTLRFPPRQYAGIVVLRLPQPIQIEEIERALGKLAALGATRSPAGKLWISPVRFKDAQGSDLGSYPRDCWWGYPAGWTGETKDSPCVRPSP